MSNPSTPLSINDIQTKLNEIQGSVTQLQSEIIRSPVPTNTQTKIVTLKTELNSILDIINKISGVDSALKSYINSLINDMKNQSLKDSFYTIQSSGEVKSTELLKAEIIMIRQISNSIPNIRSEFVQSIGTDVNADNIKKALEDADAEINI